MKKLFYSIALVLGLAVMTGCEMQEKNYSNVDATVYYQNESSVKGAVAAIYARAAYGFCEYFYYLQEFSADQVAWRTWNAGQWGWDEGLKFVLSSHTWTSEAKIVLQAWESAWTTIGLCNQLIQDLEKIKPESIGMTEESIESYIAEVRTLRAWAYYNNFELWGGALPLCVEVSSVVPGSISDDFDEGCDLISAFIEDELDDALPHLKNKGANRVSPAMNRMLKMRLLLNSEIFTGTPRYDECAALADTLLHEQTKYGTYGIANDYRQVFSIGNELCNEVVFAFSETQGQLNTGWMRNMPGLPYTYKDITNCFATNQSGWNCTCLAPSYDNAGNDLAGNPVVNADGTAYNSDAPVCFLSSKYNDKLGAVYERFEKGDVRKQPYKYDDEWNGGIFLMGAQVYRSDVTKEESADGEAHKKGEAIPADADRDKMPLIYVDQLGQFGGTSSDVAHPVLEVEGPRWGQTNSGYRLMKYPLYPKETGIDYQAIGEVEFRFAEVYFTYAECKMRTKGSVEGQSVREYIQSNILQRYFDGAVTDDVAGSWTDEEWMLHQWGLEFLGEGRRRRTDLRRFDKFTNGQWWFFGRALADDGSIFPKTRDSKYEWYPLPQAALGVNPGLKQNPNY